MDPGIKEEVVRHVLDDLERNPEYRWLQSRLVEANRLELYDMAIDIEITLGEMRDNANATIVSMQLDK